jgi:hypothetical protein
MGRLWATLRSLAFDLRQRRLYPGGPDVIAQLRRRLPSGWQASLLAVDGSRIGDLEPSSRGGEKIALAITRALGLAGNATPRTRIFY